MHRRWLSSVLVLVIVAPLAGAQVRSAAIAPFPNFEGGEVDGILVSADGRYLYVLNSADHRLEVFTTATPPTVVRRSDDGGGALPGGGNGSLAGGQAPNPGGIQGPPDDDAPIEPKLPLSRPVGSVFTGLQPVAMALHPDDPNTLFVSNWVSDDVAVVDLGTLSVRALIPVGDEPRDLVVADDKLFVACARAPIAPGLVVPGDFDENVVVTADASPPYGLRTHIDIGGVKPRALAVTGDVVWAVPQDSGNKTTMLTEEEIVTGGLDIDQLTPDSTCGSCNFQLVVNPVLSSDFMNDGVNTNPIGWPIPRVGRIVFDDEFPGNTLVLPDNDLVAIDAVSETVVDHTHGVGTTLFDVAENPETGELWIANTESKNRIRQEYNLTGDALENRVTIVPATAGASVSRILRFGPAGSVTPTDHAQPVALAFYEHPEITRSTAYVAALGTDTVVVLDAGDETLRRVIATGPQPRGLAVDQARGVLYVFTRGDKRVSAYDIHAGHALIASFDLRYDPEPLIVTVGRKHLYTARPEEGHGNRNFSCAGCHIDSHLDGLAWDLGNSKGAHGYFYPDLAGGNPLGLPPLTILTDFNTGVVNPMKGPMTVQSLRGLKDIFPDNPFHWRGDRRFFHQFRGAFKGLLGGSGITPQAMQEYSAFIRSVVYAPNPFQPKDRVYQGDAEIGRTLFGVDSAGKNYLADNVDLTCEDCHNASFDDKSNFTGGQNTVNFDGPDQFFNTPQMRFVFEKEHRELTGFGTNHAGEEDGLQGFIDHRLASSNFTGDAFPNLTTTERAQVVEFQKQWDTGMAPLVGGQIHVTQSNIAAGHAFLDLAEAQALAGNVDVIAKGVIDLGGGAAEPHGAWYSLNGGAGEFQYLIDNSGFLTRQNIFDLIAGGGVTVTFTCVPPGMGQRLGVDRDEDGLLDFQEILLGTSPADPDTDDDDFTDFLEWLLASDPLVPNGALPGDVTSPTFLSSEVQDVFVNTATASFTVLKPSTAVVNLGLSAGVYTLASFPSNVLQSRHDVVLTGLPAGVEIFYEIVATDPSSNSETVTGSFTTPPPHFHSADVELTFEDVLPQPPTGGGIRFIAKDINVTARVQVLDHDGLAVDDVNVRVLFEGDAASTLTDPWVDMRTQPDGWAEFTFQYTLTQEDEPLTVGLLFIGSQDPFDQYFVGVPDGPHNHFYDDSANVEAYESVLLN